ncbi:MAG: hypothetical protein NT011_07925 [Kiritimatiellaeota bacterium]|nr:hypothetical protein [Kiritimatiellota bacterium]
MNATKHFVVSRVLIYRDESGDYIARALELDLIGSGDAPNKALKDLENAIQAQVSFALQKGASDMIYFKAEPEYDRRWLEAAKSGMRDLATGDAAIHVKCVATVIRVEALIPKTSARKFYSMPGMKEMACARA